MPQDKVIVLVGPTAVGKTSLSLELAKRWAVEVISADSMQVYRGMDIGTAKPSRDVMLQVTHHLIDIVDPDESFNAARFKQEADRAAEGIIQRGKTPLVVGGTGLYVKAFLHGLFPGTAQENGENDVRNGCKNGVLGGNPHPILSVVDPAAARRIHPNDVIRGKRALEVYYRTGERISSFQHRHGFTEQYYDALVIGLTMDRKILYERINTRVEQMVETGLLDEVRHLIDQGYAEDVPAMGGLGYRHMIPVIRGDLSLPEAVRLLMRDTRRYAKRQFTWFRHQESVAWYEKGVGEKEIYNAIQQFLQGT